MSENPGRQYEDAYLWLPEDRAKLDQLQEALNAALSIADTLAAAPRAMSQDSPAEAARAAAVELDEFIKGAKARARVVRMVALPRTPWRALKAEHPIRMVETREKDAEGVETVTEKPHQIDEIRGFNVESMADALVPESIDASEFRNAAEKEAFLEGLSEPDFDTLYGAALKVNVAGFTPPKAEYSSRIDRIIAEISMSPDPSD